MDADIQQTIRAEVHNAVQNTQEQLLNNMTTLLESRLDGFQRRIQENQKSLSDTQIAKIDENMSDTYKFRKRGNEEQYKHNHKVFVKMREATTEMEADNMSQTNINNAKRKITEGMDIIKNRQKLIKLADSSDAGWRVVAEYIANPLAENSEDERKMYKAQSRADTKMKKEKLKKRTDQRTIPYNKTTTSNSTGSQSIPVNVSSGFGRPGRCFYCHESGHWIRQCPKATTEQKNKISINSTYNFSRIESSAPLLCKQISADFKSMKSTHTNVCQGNGTGVGYLKEKVDSWKEIGATNFVVDIIENGYKIPFSTVPRETELENNKTARDNSYFVADEIEKLLEKGCIRRVKSKPHVVNPLTVANNKGSKLRLVLDARHLNPHIVKFQTQV
ncbi:Hypothetical predicted protein [Mytilus galloprovincialis]|uniref:CCHC-type domain-containing protein n=1 Tax=Mytilus galloprovincialis TaxID=29158 RepID=A0A8B6FTG1_MYTGA|nr:Hypothetical predicted protein [Mytilus galloprovincialis]